ncbi:MAG: peptidoglycan-binding protein [Rhodospirillales bacterium]|nr:MAG: peptidoglycan-binding protein [Rhodospirillales bacterium]
MHASIGIFLNISRSSRSGQWVFAALAAMGILLSGQSAFSATAADPAKPLPRTEAPVAVDALLLAIQSLLSEMGLYHGALDGRLSKATQDAIRLHQKAWNLKQDGLPSEDLMQHLEMVAGMRRIERRLKQTKVEQISGAKRLIEESPATRRLLLEAAARPMPTVDDPKSCFSLPQPECLSVLARQSALAAPEGSMRDWALSEVASEAAEAGVPLMAWEVASRIQDPRTLIAALGSVARALAEGGYFQAALEALEAIPDVARRCEAALLLAQRQAEAGKVDGARSARSLAVRMLERLEHPEEILSARLKLAEIAIRLGEEGAATRWRIEAEQRLLTLPADARPGAMVNLSMIETSLKRFDASLQWLLQVQDGLLRVPAELKLIDALARAGREAEAENLSRNIEAPRYRVLAQVRLALAEVTLGDQDEAKRHLRDAAVMVRQIDLPFAKAFGESQIAMAWQSLGESGIAEATARVIEDEAIKAHTLWRLTDLVPQSHRDILRVEAEAATKALADPFGRVWMFAELVRERSRLGDKAGAGAYLSRGLAVAEAITDSWSRSRALAALAGAMAEMQRP